MAYRYQLATPDGEIFAAASYAYPPNVGDEIHVPREPRGVQRMKVTAYIPVELVGEFVDNPVHGVLEVEPV